MGSWVLGRCVHVGDGVCVCVCVCVCVKGNWGLKVEKAELMWMEG